MTTAKQNNVQQKNYNFLTNENTSANIQNSHTHQAYWHRQIQFTASFTSANKQTKYSLYEILHSVLNEYGMNTDRTTHLKCIFKKLTRFI